MCILFLVSSMKVAWSFSFYDSAVKSFGIKVRPLIQEPLDNYQLLMVDLAISVEVNHYQQYPTAIFYHLICVCHASYLYQYILSKLLLFKS